MSDLSRWLDSLSSRLHIIIATVGILIFAGFMGITIGNGNLLIAYILILSLLMVGVVLKLGSNYWMLIPFGFLFQFPAIPIGGRSIELPELLIAVCCVAFVARYALGQQPFTLFRADHVPILLYTGWVIYIYVNNPVGLSQFNASTGGARFYAKILMALAAFLIMANQQIDARDCKRVLTMAVGGAIFNTGFEIFTFFHPISGLGATEGPDLDSYYTWHQSLANAPMVVTLILLSRYKATELFTLQKAHYIAGLIPFLAIIVLSGKRAALAAIPIYAVSAAFIRKEYNYLLLWVGVAVVAFTIIITCHGTLFTLPLVAQRTLSWLPAQWDSDLDIYKGGRDIFREAMRELAADKINRDPWIGRGYGLDTNLMNSISSRDMTSWAGQVKLLALGSSWHNTWLGYAADFGIPASIFIGLIYLHIVSRSWSMATKLPYGGMLHTMTMYVLLFTIRDVANSHTSGHSALDAFGRWWMYGILVSIALGQTSRALKERLPGSSLKSISRKPLSLAVPVQGVQRF